MNCECIACTEPHFYHGIQFCCKCDLCEFKSGIIRSLKKLYKHAFRRGLDPVETRHEIEKFYFVHYNGDQIMRFYAGRM